MNSGDSNSSAEEDSSKVSVFFVDSLELTGYWVQGSRRELTAIAESCIHLIIDISDARYIDSPGMSLFLHLHRICSKKGGLVILTSAHHSIRREIELLQLPVEFAATVEDARVLVRASGS